MFKFLMVSVAAGNNRDNGILQNAAQRYDNFI